MKNFATLLFITSAILFSCSKDKVQPSSEKEMLTFGFKAADNTALTNDVAATISGKNISVSLPAECELNALKATFTASPKAVVSIGPQRQIDRSTVNDFRNPVIYTVVAEDGTSSNYSVVVTRVLSTNKDIKSFFFEKANNPELREDITTTIDLLNRKINCTVPLNTPRNSLVASFTLSKGAQLKIGNVVQNSGITPNNFESTLTYSVIAENGSSSDYTVTVNKTLNTEKELNSFVLEKSKNPALPYDIVFTIDQNARKLSYEFPSDIVKNHLIPTFSVSSNAQVKINNVAQVSGVTPINFDNNLNLDVTAEDGSVCTYTYEVKSEQLPTIDQTKIQNKIRALNYQRRTTYQNSAQFPNIEVIPILSTTWQSSKPADAFPFDCGYVGNDGKIYVSKPLYPEQKALFPDVNVAALFYVCKAFIKHYYKNSEMPIWFSNGFAAFESGALPGDEAVKTAINNFGGTLPSFSDLNNRGKFTEKNGIAIAWLFGEFLSSYYCWPYWDIIATSSNDITLAPWRFGTFADFEQKWIKYSNYRILRSESTRIKWQQESEHFRYLYRDADSFNYPLFSNTLEEAYSEYKTKLGVSFPIKLTVVSIPESESAYIDGIPNPGRITGGTAWASGLVFSCANKSEELQLFPSLLRHELAHEFQAILMKPGVSMPAWLNEGFPSFMQMGGMVTPEKKAEWKSDANKALADATAYFKHQPTFEDIAVYPNPYFNYYLLGEIMYEFIYSVGGNAGVKAITEDPATGISYLGFATPEAFMVAYYAYFNSQWR